MERLKATLRVLAAFVCIWTGFDVTAAAQVSRPFSAIEASWTRTLDQVEAAIVAGVPGHEAMSHRENLVRLRADALDQRQKATERLRQTEALLAALGPVPAEGEPPEAKNIAEQRAALATDIADYRARIAQSDLVLARANAIERQLAAKSRSEFIDVLLHRTELPFKPSTFEAALGDMYRSLQRVARAPAEWWREKQDVGETAAVISSVSLAIISAIVAALLLRNVLAARLRPDLAVEAPSYRRRVAAVVGVAIWRGAFPLCFIGAALFLSIGPQALFDGLMRPVVTAAAMALLLVVTTAVIAHAVLLPVSAAWRIVPLEQSSCRRLEFGVVLLALALAAHSFLRIAISSSELNVSSAFVSVMAMTITAVEAALIVVLMRRSVWQFQPIDLAAPVDGEPLAADVAVQGPRRLWVLLRPVVAMVAIAGAVASALGYPVLGMFVVGRLCMSGLLVGAFVVLRGLLREAVGALLRSTVLRDTLEFKHRTRSITKFWVRAFLDVVLFLALLMLVAAVWNAPVDEVGAWTRQILAGFTVGQVRISIGAILTAIGVFLAVVFLTRVLQRGLRNQVLPQTSFDAGVQNSLASGFGYLGIALAVALSVSAAGIDLSNIALIAGALSVGIGFGLQNVVSNFVSGIILLIERPVKVGDWIVVNQNEGYVKTISVRATELETFQRASVIIPNADILSNAVQNWTHKDRIGRIDIPVGVAYGSDTNKVRQILIDVARQHDEVSAWPEPNALFLEFGESSLNFELRCFTGNVMSRLAIGSDLRFEIAKRFEEEGVEIPFPQRVVHLQPKTITDRGEAAESELEPPANGR